MRSFVGTFSTTRTSNGPSLRSASSEASSRSTHSQWSFEQIDTVVQALLPHPINVNTASQEVLTALIEGVRRGPGGAAHGDRGNRVFGHAEAE